MTDKPYPWLASIGVLPRGVTQALALLGTEELAGAKSNPIIISWRDELARAGVKGLEGYKDDGVPWCGLFAGIVTLRAGKRPVDAPLWAMNWSKYGVEVARNVGTTALPSLHFPSGMKASLGDTLVFARKVTTGYAGHVGRYIAEDDEAYHVIGGNQSDSVTIARVAKNRCIAVRRDVIAVPPPSLRPYKVAKAGPLSTREA